MSTSNFQRAVKDALLKLANKIDSGGTYNGAKSDYYDVVISSVQRIADEYEAPTPELPAVTASDAGDVLTVSEEGEWVAAQGGSGGVSVIDGSNASVTINDVEYSLITVGASAAMKDMAFVLVEPSVIAAEPPFVVVDAGDSGYYSSAAIYRPFTTEPMSAVDVSTDNIYPTSPITLIAVMIFDGEEPIALIPNNATYAAGVKDK